MTGGAVFCSWGGPGRTYQRPVSGTTIRSANQLSRFLPYRVEGNAHIVSAPGSQNAGDPQAAEEGRGMGSFVSSKPPS